MKISLMSIPIVILVTSLGTAQNVNMDENKLANQGYDLVNYFTTNTAQRGSASFSTVHRGATYYFASAENLKTFKGNPKGYLPQFGGHCAFGVAEMKQKVPVDPKTFRIDDGKLYLFYNDFWEGKPFNTIIPWLADEAEKEKMAYANWEAIKNDN